MKITNHVFLIGDAEMSDIDKDLWQWWCTAGWGGPSPPGEDYMMFDRFQAAMSNYRAALIESMTKNGISKTMQESIFKDAEYCA